MSSRNATFIVLALFLILFRDTTSSWCTQVAPCRCLLPDGYYYNLEDLAAEKSLQASSANGSSIVYFQPCKNVKMHINNTTECAPRDGVSLCLYNNQNGSAQILGTIEQTQMKLSGGKDNFPIFEIHHDNITSVINIMCSTSKTDFIIENSQSLPSRFNYFILSSPYGCKIDPPKELSTGSVLVICFFTIVGTYLIVGIIALRTLRGATGWEMLPNYNFWHKLPALVKDGVIFTFNCCRVDSYERI